MPGGVGGLTTLYNIDFNADIQLRDTKPNKYVRFFQFGTSGVAGWNFGGIQQYLRFTENAQVTLHNFWRVTGRVVVHRRSLSDDLTRGGPLMGTELRYQGGLSASNRAGSRTRLRASANMMSDEF